MLSYLLALFNGARVRLGAAGSDRPIVSDGAGSSDTRRAATSLRQARAAGVGEAFTCAEVGVDRCNIPLTVPFRSRWRRRKRALLSLSRRAKRDYKELEAFVPSDIQKEVAVHSNCL